MLESRAAFTEFIAQWEAGTLPKERWTHAAHVALGACYAVRHGARALEHTRAGIRRYNAAVGTADTETSGYHETLTRFWCEQIAAALGPLDDEYAAARLAVERFGDARDLVRAAWSFDVVRDRRARREWVPPDQPLAVSSRTIRA